MVVEGVDAGKTKTALAGSYNESVGDGSRADCIPRDGMRMGTRCVVSR